MTDRPWFGKWALLFVVMGVFWTAAVPARAEEPVDRNAAIKMFQRGLELEQAEDWTGALQVFRDVGQYRMTPQVRFHIALCESKLGKLVAALGGYELALQDATSVGPDFANEVTTKVDELRARIPKLTIRRGEGAEAAVISLDGVELGAPRIGVEILLDPGPHPVAARAPGYEGYQETIVLGESDVKELVINLRREHVIDATDPEIPPPPPPKAAGGGSFPVGPVLLGGTGLALLGTSAVFFVRRNDLRNKLETAKCGDACDDAGNPNKTTYDDMVMANTLTNVTLGVGIAAVVGGVTWYILDSGGDSEDGDSSDEPDDSAAAQKRPLVSQLRVGLGAPYAETGISIAGSF